MRGRAETIVAIFLMFILTAGILCVGVSCKNEEIRVQKAISKLNITKAKTTIRNGYTEIDTRYLIVGKEKHILYREFKNPREAFKQFNERNKQAVKKIRKKWWVVGDFSEWNWNLYRAALNEENNLTREEEFTFLRFFDIYENIEQNQETLKQFI